MRAPTNRAQTGRTRISRAHTIRAHVGRGIAGPARTIQTRNTSVGRLSRGGTSNHLTRGRTRRGAAPPTTVGSRRARTGEGQHPADPTGRRRGHSGPPAAAARDAPGQLVVRRLGGGLRHRRRLGGRVLLLQRYRAWCGWRDIGPARGRSDPAPTLADVPADGAFGVFVILRWLTFRHGITPPNPSDGPLTPCMSADGSRMAPRGRGVGPQSSVGTDRSGSDQPRPA